MITVQMFNILIKDSAACKLNILIKWKTRQAVLEGKAGFMVDVVHSLSSPIQGLPSCLQRAGRRQCTKYVVQCVCEPLLLLLLLVCQPTTEQFQHIKN